MKSKEFKPHPLNNEKKKKSLERMKNSIVEDHMDEF